MLPIAILAGGLATRLRPITSTIPKALLEVAGKPFICHQLAYLYSEGIRNVTLCIGHLGEMIQSVVGNGSQFGLQVTYSIDGPALLGTGGALRQALPFLGKAFFVLYGDSFLPIEFAPVEKAFENSNKLALMTVLKNSNRWDKSNVLFNGHELREYNKHAPRPEMAYIDYGLGVMAGNALESYAPGKAFDLADVYHNLSIRDQLAGYEVYERFYEIGSLDGLKETETFFLKRDKA